MIRIKRKHFFPILSPPQFSEIRVLFLNVIESPVSIYNIFLFR